MVKPKISILGCGWLGHPLAKHFVNSGFETNGSTTHVSKLEKLKKNGINPYIIDFNTKDVIPKAFLDAKTIVIATPHKVVENFERIIRNIETSSIENVIFISSTSVYENNQGITNESSTLSTSNNLVKIEDLFRQSEGFKTTVLRFSGLIGPNRHPGHFFKSGKLIPNPNGQINLIHLDDCIHIIDTIVQNNVFPHTFNCSSSGHPTRQDFYKAAYSAKGRPEPVFDYDSTTHLKIINSDLLKGELNYNFKFDYIIDVLDLV